jgi:predicted DNA-binding transcriptional regulator AlpA
MTEATVKHPDELPAVLNAKHIQNVLGLSRLKTYEVMNSAGFPALRFGRVIRVPKAAFFRWLDEQAGAAE